MRTGCWAWAGGWVGVGSTSLSGYGKAVAGGRRGFAWGDMAWVTADPLGSGCCRGAADDVNGAVVATWVGCTSGCETGAAWAIGT